MYYITPSHIFLSHISRVKDLVEWDHHHQESFKAHLISISWVHLTTKFSFKTCRITINLSQDNSTSRNMYRKGSLLLVSLFNKGEYPSKLFWKFEKLLKKTFNYLNVTCYNTCFWVTILCLLQIKIQSCQSKINNTEHTQQKQQTNAFKS